ncbi:MAG: YbaB/EbfC family nucleoid-associated protein [Clostridia bacterium]|nr:YbaB/EbfC family nucleoid-associated protein [Clostridia bacterium]
MAKGKFNGMGGMPNMNNMLKQAQKMQQEMQKQQEELENSTVEATAGGGAITVTMTGSHKLTSVRIKPEACDPDDVEMLEDLIITAVNDAISQINQISAKNLEKVTGGFNIPGLF